MKLTHFCKHLILLATLLPFCSLAFGSVVVDFEELPVNAGGFFNGDVAAGSPFRDNYVITGTQITFGEVETLQLWNSNGVQFNNNYIQAFSSWSGWSWSNVTDNTSPGFSNQYSASTGGGSNGMGGIAPGGKYAMAFADNAYFDVQPGWQLESVEVTNSTFAALSMANGDQFAKKFGGASGNDADLFQVTLTGYDSTGAGNGAGTPTGSLTVDLADYRFADNSQDFILTDWQNVDLSSLAGARSIGLSFFSTDSGAFGINTPTFVAFDNLRFSAVPEPTFLSYIFALPLLLRRRMRT